MSQIAKYTEFYTKKLPGGFKLEVCYTYDVDIFEGILDDFVEIMFLEVTDGDGNSMDVSGLLSISEGLRDDLIAYARNKELPRLQQEFDEIMGGNRL